jgi:hypothetical protein
MYAIWALACVQCCLARMVRHALHCRCKCKQTEARCVLNPCTVSLLLLMKHPLQRVHVSPWWSPTVTGAAADGVPLLSICIHALDMPYAAAYVKAVARLLLRDLNVIISFVHRGQDCNVHANGSAHVPAGHMTCSGLGRRHRTGAGEHREVPHADSTGSGDPGAVTLGV